MSLPLRSSTSTSPAASTFWLGSGRSLIAHRTYSVIAMQAKPTMPAIHARLAHSQAIGRAQSACWPPRATGPVDTLRAPPLGAHLGEDVPRVSASRGQRPVVGGYSGNRFKLNSAELDRDPAFAVRCGDPDRGHVVVRTHDVGVVVGARHELGVDPRVVD